MHKHIPFLFFCLFCISCNPSTPPLSSLIRNTPEPQGTHCELGGEKIEIGFDKNSNLELDDEEIDPEKTFYLCNKTVEGIISRLLISKEPPGTQCEQGGIKIQSGLDYNANGDLDESEIESTAFLCDGEDGINGIDGIDGTDGTDGFNFLIRFREIEAGLESQCVFGGVEVRGGLDRNRNNELEETEITTEQHVCSVEVETDRALLRHEAIIPAGACVHGGVRFLWGWDENNNGTLEIPEEVQTEFNICNEVTPAPGLSSLIRTNPATAQQCTYGGFIFYAGLDTNGNGILGNGEINANLTQVVCNGIPGINSAVNIEQDPAECGSAGGVEIQTGLDDVVINGQLDFNEIDLVSYVCNGSDGLDGNGHSALIEQYDAGEACGVYGGIRVETGIDDNDNFILDSPEVDTVSFVCNGVDGIDGEPGYNSLINVEDAGSGECEFGGVWVDVGLDNNPEDGILQNSEIDQSTLVCF